jgi:hypothetical protein
MRIIIKPLKLLCAIIIFAALQLYCSNNSNQENDYMSLIKDLKSNDLKTVREAIYELHMLSTSAIPYLIEEIDDTSRTYINLMDPFASTLSLGTCNQGVLAAYMIELVFRREELIKSENYSLDVLFPFINQPGITNYIFRSGVIVKRKGEYLTYEDMQKIKAYFKFWWHENKDESIVKLRVEWRKDNHPLNDTEYQWR